MTMRLSMSSLAGTARTEVAVGTSSEPSMFVTTRAAGPRSGEVSLPPMLGTCGVTVALGKVGAAVAVGSGVTAPGRGCMGAGGSLPAGSVVVGPGVRPVGRCGRWGGHGWRRRRRPVHAVGRHLDRWLGWHGDRAGERHVRGLVVGEEVPPCLVHRLRVGEVRLVELVDQPLVGSEAGHGVRRHERSA